MQNPNSQILKDRKNRSQDVSIDAVDGGDSALSWTDDPRGQEDELNEVESRSG